MRTNLGFVVTTTNWTIRRDRLTIKVVFPPMLKPTFTIAAVIASAVYIDYFHFDFLENANNSTFINNKAYRK